MIDIRMDAALHNKTVQRLLAMDKSLISDLQKGIKVGLEYIRGQLTLAIVSGKYGIKTDTGAMVQSINTQVTGLRGKVGPNVPYGGIHERGGTITPKLAKFLAIPVHPEAKGKSPREFPDLFLWKRGGRAMLMRKYGRHDFEPYYVLKNSVTIKATGYMSKTLASVRPVLADKVLSEVRKAFAK